MWRKISKGKRRRRIEETDVWMRKKMKKKRKKRKIGFGLGYMIGGIHALSYSFKR